MPELQLNPGLSVHNLFFSSPTLPHDKAHYLVVPTCKKNLLKIIGQNSNIFLFWIAGERAKESKGWQSEAADENEARV